MKYYIISGETSGDLYGSYLIKSLNKLDKKSIFFCWGGEYMEKKGGQMIRTLDKLSFMGFFEVVKNWGAILKNLKIVKRDIKQKNPDAIILIDYPGFNFQVAQFSKKLKIPVFWFVAPQVWAWKESRIKKIKKYIDRMYVILPFEKEYFFSKNLSVQYFGHPLMEIINNQTIEYKKRRKIIALFPGSRKQEIKKILPEMLKLIFHFKDYEFIIGGVKSVSIHFYRKIIESFNVKLVFDQTYKLMNLASAAVVTSGTVSLESAIYKLPQVVCYKTSFLSYFLAKKFVKTKYISLVNIILNKKVIDELIQTDCNIENLIISLERALNKNNIQELHEEYNHLISQLGSRNVFDNVTKNMLDFIKKNN